MIKENPGKFVKLCENHWKTIPELISYTVPEVTIILNFKIIFLPPKNLKISTNNKKLEISMWLKNEYKSLYFLRCIYTMVNFS